VTGLTGLTDASPLWDLPRVNVWVSFLSSRCRCFEFGSVRSSVGLFGGFGVSWLEPV
jgi:hypothetical protein